jgi:hypothetical protein
MRRVRRLLLSLGLFAVLALLTLGVLVRLGIWPADDSGPRPAPTPPPALDTSAALPSPEQLERLARTDAVAFLRAGLLRYRREVQGYRAVLQKQERLNGKLGPVEVIDVCFREQPFSVLLRWKTPPSGLVDRALYVAGQNDGKALGRGKYLHLIHSRDPYGSDARDAGRYPLPEFGIAKGTERTLTAWEAAQRHGRLRVEYLGVRAVPDAGGVECYVLRRTCDPPEEDGVTVVEVAFDVEHWLQVGNKLTDADGQLIGAYYFRDVALNPEFPPGQFERAALSRD